jgi:hypothetical protein
MRKMNHLRQQRSGKINNTLINRKPPPPFRELDGVMRIGKFKGKHIQDLPKNYIKWMLRNLDLNYGRKEKLKDLL